MAYLQYEQAVKNKENKILTSPETRPLTYGVEFLECPSQGDPGT